MQKKIIKYVNTKFFPSVAEHRFTFRNVNTLLLENHFKANDIMMLSVLIINDQIDFNNMLC